MSNKPNPRKPWDTTSFALCGAALGFVLGIVHAYVHAFWSQAQEDDLIGHILWTFTFRVVAGAALFAAVLHLMLELFGATLGGALLLCALGWILNQQAVKKGQQG